MVKAMEDYAYFIWYYIWIPLWYTIHALTFKKMVREGISLAIDDESVNLKLIFNYLGKNSYKLSLNYFRV